MSSDEEAQKAIEMLNNSSFMDRNIVVNEAKPQGERERGRGGPQEKEVDSERKKARRKKIDLSNFSRYTGRPGFF